MCGWANCPTASAMLRGSTALSAGGLMTVSCFSGWAVGGCWTGYSNLSDADASGEARSAYKHAFDEPCHGYIFRRYSPPTS